MGNTGFSGTTPAELEELAGTGLAAGAGDNSEWQTLPMALLRGRSHGVVEQAMSAGAAWMNYAVAANAIYDVGRLRVQCM